VVIVHFGIWYSLLQISVPVLRLSVGFCHCGTAVAR
jgi:hypothetical protein